MQEILDVYSLKFINKTDIIEEIEGGHSGALLYKVTRGKNKFFLKIFKEILDIELVREYISIYNKLNIKSLEIIDFGYIDYLYKYYIVYNFIEGKNLKEYTKNNQCDLEDVRKMGTLIGKELLKLKQYENYNHNLLICDDINAISENAKENFNLIMQNKTYRDIVLKHFTEEDINNLYKKITEYSSIFKDIQPRLIHGDIKRSNFMVSKNNELYITDIESMKVSYDVLNFKYQITWSLFEGSEKEAAFVKGYFDAIYSNTRPKNFNNSIIFTMILNFFLESYGKYIKNNSIGLETYVQKCKCLFDKINTMNLNTQFLV